MTATQTTLTVDAGLLGEIEITVSYRYWKGRSATNMDPPEPATIQILWVKVGEMEIEPGEKLEDVIKDHCLADWEGDGVDVDVLIDRMKDERAEREAA